MQAKGASRNGGSFFLNEFELIKISITHKKQNYETKASTTPSSQT